MVLDGFGGSGSTLIAAHKTGRRAYLIELDPLYCDRIIRRWESYAKDDALLIACGAGSEGSCEPLTFDTVSRSRRPSGTGERRAGKPRSEVDPNAGEPAARPVGSKPARR